MKRQNPLLSQKRHNSGVTRTNPPREGWGVLLLVYCEHSEQPKERRVGQYKDTKVQSTMNRMHKRLLQMYKLAVWDASGRMYMPLYGYDGEIVAYGRAEDAIEQWIDDIPQEEI